MKSVQISVKDLTPVNTPVWYAKSGCIRTRKAVSGFFFPRQNQGLLF